MSEWQTTRPSGSARQIGAGLFGSLEVDLLAPVTSRFHASWEQALPEIPPGQQSTPVLLYGSLMMRLYKPYETDIEVRQKHDQLYLIARGEGIFFNGAHLCGDDPIQHFKAGDVLFVPAGVVHRFRESTDDCLVWSVFFGPLHDGSMSDHEMNGKAHR